MNWGGLSVMVGLAAIFVAGFPYTLPMLVAGWWLWRRS